MKIFPLSVFSCVLLFCSTYFTASSYTQAKDIPLRPAKEAFLTSFPRPFYQALPQAKGSLRLKENESLALPQFHFPHRIQPLTYWPDGSIRLIAIEGFLPVQTPPPTQAVRFSIVPSPDKSQNVSEKTSDSAPVASSVTLSEDKSAFILKSGTAFASTWKPTASMIPIKKPRPALSGDVEYLQEEGQYAWAADAEMIGASTEEIIPLEFLIRSCREVESNPLFATIQVRGENKSSTPALKVEFQVTLQVYHDYDFIRGEITWKFLHDIEKYAVASASWSVDTTTSFEQWSSSQDQFGDFSTPVTIASEANGTISVTQNDSLISKFASPAQAPAYNGLLAHSEQDTWMLSIPHLTRFGPNHLRIHDSSFEIASWSPLHSRFLDLRPTGQADEFGVRTAQNETVLESNGHGMAHTLPIFLARADNKEPARALLNYTQNQHHIWLPSAEDLDATQALNPFNLQFANEHPDAFRALETNMLFLVRSRDYWKWYGLANFGDFRTNFAVGRNEDRGLFPLRWALNGRYGWRNGSGSITSSLISAGLQLNSREIAMAGLQHGFHIASVDIQHGSFYKPYRGSQGGMHRRNRDHWSGSVQMQYSPTIGIYMTQWLTGSPWVQHALKGLRDFATNDTGASSAFKSQAWILHYMETMNPQHLATAKEFLQQAAQWWHDRTKEGDNASITPENPLHSLYLSNFRRVSDGLNTIIFFHQATNDPAYLDILLQSTLVNTLNDKAIGAEASGFVVGYLLANGVPVSAFPADQLQQLKEKISSQQYPTLADPKPLSYQELVHIITTQLPPVRSPQYRESNAISKFADYLWLTQEWLTISSEETTSPSDTSASRAQNNQPSDLPATPAQDPTNSNHH